MPCATITINAPTTYVDLYTLLKGTQPSKPYSVLPSVPTTGYTVTPPQGILGLGIGQRISRLSIQSSRANAAGSIVFVGDSNLVPVSCQGRELAVGEVQEVFMQNVNGLAEIFLGASAGGIKVNIELQWE